MRGLAEKQDTIRFWYQYLTSDCFAYVALFVAIRYRNWELRMGSLKQQAAIFSAFDRTIYERLIPQHLRDILCLPEPVLTHLQNGSFSVPFNPSEWHGVAIDECHEMKINKDAKLAVVRPSKDKMAFLSNHLSFRATCVYNLTDQIFPEQGEASEKFTHRPTSKDKKAHVNVQRMCTSIVNHGMFHNANGNQGLWNILEGKKATEEQSHDLLNFRAIGQRGLEQFIERKYTKEASTEAPVRQKRLCTFTVNPTQKQRIKQADRERKLYQRYLKRSLAWVAEHGMSGTDMESLFGPIQAVPRALVDADSLPYKANKSATTAHLGHRYQNPPAIINTLPSGWVPDTVILEGMFLIQTSPLPTMSCMEDYVKLLLARFVCPHFTAGAKEVHVVFDCPGSLPETLKELEQRQRDKGVDSTTHHCTSFSGDLMLPSKWRSVLGCRACKKELTRYVADEMLTLIHRSLKSSQRFVANIAQQAFGVSCDIPV